MSKQELHPLVGYLYCAVQDKVGLSQLTQPILDASDLREDVQEYAGTSQRDLAAQIVSLMVTGRDHPKEAAEPMAVLVRALHLRLGEPVAINVSAYEDRENSRWEIGIQAARFEHLPEHERVEAARKLAEKTDHSHRDQLGIE